MTLRRATNGSARRTGDTVFAESSAADASAPFKRDRKRDVPTAYRLCARPFAVSSTNYRTREATRLVCVAANHDLATHAANSVTLAGAAAFNDCRCAGVTNIRAATFKKARSSSSSSKGELREPPRTHGKQPAILTRCFSDRFVNRSVMMPSPRTRRTRRSHWTSRFSTGPW